MISEFFLNIIFGIVSNMFDALPDISWSVDSTAFDYIIGILKVVGYMLPWGTVATIIGLIVALNIFRFGVAVIKTIWDLLPLV